MMNPTTRGAMPDPGIGASAAEERAVSWLSLVAVPLLALIIYTNFSDVAMRSLSLPSVLQPLIFILGAAVWRYRNIVRAGTIMTLPLTVALAAYTIVLFCSSIWAQDVRLADDRIVDSAKNLAIYAIAASLTISWASLRRVITVLTAGASALAIVTMTQTLTHDYTHEYLGFARIQVAHLYQGIFEVRPAGPIGDPNFYAQFLLMLVPLAVFTAVAEPRGRRRVLLFIGAAIMAAGTVLTYSRGAMLALGLATVLSLLALRVRPRQLLALAAVTVILLFAMPAEVTNRLLTVESLVPGTSERADSSIVKRRLLLAVAARMFDDHLIGGVGAGNFTRHYAVYANEVGSGAPQYDPPGSRQFPHTLYLEIGAETGLLGLAAFGAAIMAAFLALLRARRGLLASGDGARAAIVTGLAISLTCYLVTSLFLHGSFQRYLWLLFALIAAATRLAAGAIESTVPARSPGALRTAEDPS